MHLRDYLDVGMVLLMFAALCGLLWMDFQEKQAALQNDQVLLDAINDLDLRLQRAEAFKDVLTNDTTAGQYRPKEKFIWVQTTDSPQVIFSNVRHEYGHVVYYQVLNASDRRAWENISNSSTEFVTEYAKKSPSEDFAESFMAGVSCTYTGADVPAGKDVFMRERVVPVLRSQEVLQ